MLPVATFDAHEAAARIGLPPLAAEGEALLHSIHAQTVQIWETNALAPIDLLITLVDDGAARAINAHHGNPAVPMNCTSGQFVSAMGVLRGEPGTLALHRAQFLAQHILGSLISKVEADGPLATAYPQRIVNFMVNGRMGSESIAMPAPGPACAEFSISCFIQDRGTAQGSIECGGVGLPWQYSNGILGLPREAAVHALGVTSAWVRVAVAAAMSASTSMVPA